MKLYLGMALHNADESFRTDFRGDLVTEIKEDTSIEVLEFVGAVGGTSLQVYEHDRAQVEVADLCVFICDQPSLGLGMEIAIRLDLGKPMVIISKTGITISRTVTGMCEKYNIPHEQYETIEDIVGLIQKYKI